MQGRDILSDIRDVTAESEGTEVDITAKPIS